MTRRSSLAALVFVAACGSLGKPGEFSEQILHGGTGPFRLATQAETGLSVSPGGSIFRSTLDSIGRAYVATDVAIYDVATRLAMPPMRDPALPEYAIDPAQYQPRRIARATTHVVGTDGLAALGFEFGTDVLVPTEAWEANGVYDPAVVRMPDGSVRIYYATDAGLGVASSPTVEGTFTRLTNTPLLADVDGRGPARKPAVAVLPSGELLLYFELAGSIYVARSQDGLAFSVVDSDATTPALDPLPLVIPDDAPTPTTDAGVAIVETGRGSPSVVVTESRTGRLNVRLYFESRASDGTVAIHVAGSFDGLAFDRSAIVCYRKGNPTSPSAFLPDDGITRLTIALQRNSGGVVSGAPVLTMTPPERTLPPP